MALEERRKGRRGVEIPKTSTFLQNEGKVESLGVLGMQEIEESLVSVGALTAPHETDPDVTSDKIAPDANFINPSQLIPGSGKKLMVSNAAALFPFTCVDNDERNPLRLIQVPFLFNSCIY